MFLVGSTRLLSCIGRLQIEVQTRSEGNGLAYWRTFSEAMAEAKKDPSIWKISFSLETDERIRLVRTTDNQWILSDLMEEVNALEAKNRI